MTHNNKQYHSASELRGPFSASHYPMTTMTTAAMDHNALLLSRGDPYLYTTEQTTPTQQQHNNNGNFAHHKATTIITPVSGKTTELDQDSEIRSASRAAPCHLPPIQVSSTDITSATQSSHTMAYTGYENDNNASKPYSPQGVMIPNSSSSSTSSSISNNGVVVSSSASSAPIITSINSTITSTPLSTVTSTSVSLTATPATITDRERTDAYLLFCADQRENDNDRSLDQQWNELSQSHKKKYHQRAIIINSKLSEEENNDDEDNNKNKDKRFIPDKIITAVGKRTAMEHLVSPDAIREAEREEKEELLGSNAEHHPFSAYPSILSMKQQERRNSSSSNSASPPPTFSPDQPYHYDLEEDSPSPSSSATISSSMGDREDSLIISSLDDTNSTNVTNMFSNNHYLDDTSDMQQQQQHHQQQQPGAVKERLKRPPNAYLLFNRDIRRRLLEESPKMTVAEISKEIGERWKRLDAESRQNYMQQAALIKQDHLKNHPDFIYTRRSKAQLAEARKFSRSRKGSHNHTNNNSNCDHNKIVSSGAPTATVSNTMVASTPLPTAAGWPAAPTTSTAEEIGGATLPTNYTADHTLVPHKRRRKSGMHDGPRDPRGRKKKRYRHPTAPKHPMSGFLFFLAAVRPEVARRYPGSTVGPISKVIASRWRDMTDEARIPWLQMAEDDKARYAREMRVYTASLEKEVEDPSLSASEEATPDDPFIAGIVHMVDSNNRHDHNDTSDNIHSIINTDNNSNNSNNNQQHHHHHHNYNHSMYDPVQLSSISLPPTAPPTKHNTTLYLNSKNTSTSPTGYHYYPHHHPQPGDLLYRSDGSRSLSAGYAVISGPNEYS